jgi:hypothetical protein
MQVGDLIKIQSNDKQVTLIGIFLGVSEKFDYRIYYNNDRIADFDFRFWTFEVIDGHR